MDNATEMRNALLRSHRAHAEYNRVMLGGKLSLGPEDPPGSDGERIKTLQAEAVAADADVARLKQERKSASSG